MVLIALVTSLFVAEGQVTMPLADYVDLVERAEASERAARDAARDSETAVAEVVSQQTSIVWNEDGADVTATYEIELRGRPTRPVVIPVSGLVFEAATDPVGNASLQADAAGLRFVAPEPGSYTLTVSSRARVNRERGVASLTLAPFAASVGEYEISLPEELLFRCSGAVIADETLQEGRRIVRFALPRGEPTVVEARRDLMDEDSETVLASAVVVTVVNLRSDGPMREDLIFYEVSRGTMAAFELALPEGLDVERVRTDEGEKPGLVDAGTLTVDRDTKLSGTGFVSLVSHPTPTLAAIPLDGIVPSTPVRARYLALRSSIAADVAPMPEDLWARVDLADLPRAVRGSQLVAAWRLDGRPAAPTLKVSARPPARFLETVVTARDSLTLLTAEGTLVHRERFDVQSRGSAFSLRFLPGTTLWSVRVNDLLVRPIERDGDTLIPLSFGGRDIETVEIVAVRNQELPVERSKLALALAEVAGPVWTHTWRVMLPEGSLYRYSRGTLHPPLRVEPPEGSGRFAVEGRSRALGMGGSSGIWGRVFDASGAPLPGTTVTLTESNTGWSAAVMSDRNGAFHFVALRRGTYHLRAELSGFSPAYYEGIELASGETAAYAIRLDVASVAETVTVTGPPPRLSTADAPAAPSEEAAAYGQQALQLKQGLVGGVKPIPIVIPESGKLITLTGVMPPASVTVELDVKPR